MPDLTVKQHDTFPVLRATLTDAVGPVDLTGAVSITLRLKSPATSLNRTCTKDPDQVNKKGQLTYAWVAADTANATTFNAEFEVDWGSSQIQTFPSTGYKTIEIVADLG